MKNIAIFSILSFAISIASAQSSPEEYIDGFFTEISKENYSKALEVFPSSETLKNDTVLTGKVLNKLEAGAKKLGKYCGYEMVSKEELSPSYITYAYYIKYQEAPQKIQFVFYKPTDKWQLNRVSLAGVPNPRQAGQQQKFRR